MTHCALLATALAGMLLSASGLKLSHEADSCDCLGWADAKAQGANCDSFGDDLCTRFIMRLPNENWCMNKQLVDTSSIGQWCYVSQDCAASSATQWGTMGVKTKSCTADEPKLGDKTFEELVAWSIANDMDVGLVAQFAYPIWGPEKLPDVLEHFHVTAPTPKDEAPTEKFEEAPTEKFLRLPESQDLYNRLEAQKTSSGTMFYNSRSGHPPFGVSEGSKFYWVNYGSEILKVLNATGDPGADFFAHPGVINIAKCVAGCETVDPPWWSWVEAADALATAKAKEDH